MKKVCFAFLGLFLLALALLWSGCGKSTKPKEEAQTKVVQANAALEAELYDLIQSDLSGVGSPSDIDFSAASALYKAALAKDPENLDANFGAGLTEFLTLSVDPEVNEVFEDWDAYLDTGNFFTPRPAVLPAKGFTKSVIGRGFPTGKKDFELPANFLAGTIATVLYRGLHGIPQVHDIQDIIDTKLLPRVDYALARLRKVTANPGYRFIVTPKMQGDENEDPLELDLTEIYLVITSLDLIKSLGNTATSYNFDIPTYNQLGLLQVTQQSSAFLGLQPSGGAKLTAAKNAFLDATLDLENAVNFLRGETDDQNDDIIKIDRTIANEELDTVLVYTPRIRNTLNSAAGEEVGLDFNGDGIEDTVALAVGKFFDNPVSNWKAELPPYTVQVEKDSSYFCFSPGDCFVFDYFWVVVITWNANTFSEWVLPNPTFNGILPGMTDAEFKSLIGVDAGNWTKELRIDFLKELPD